MSYVVGLPPDSALVRATTDGWDDTRELAASQLELTHALYRATLAAAGAKKGSIPKQMRVPRPEREDPAPRAASDDEVMAFFAAMVPTEK